MLTKNIIIVLSLILLTSCGISGNKESNVENNDNAVIIYKTATGSGIDVQEGGFGITQ